MGLIGKVVRIISDNELYSEWLNRDLKIINAYNDFEMYPDKLCHLRDIETGEDCPYSLYEYEFS